MPCCRCGQQCAADGTTPFKHALGGTVFRGERWHESQHSATHLGQYCGEDAAARVVCIPTPLPTPGLRHAPSGDNIHPTRAGRVLYADLLTNVVRRAEELAARHPEVQPPACRSSPCTPRGTA